MGPWPAELDVRRAWSAPTSTAGRTLPITVVIPAYNREVLIVRALRSVRAQRPRPPAEIVVVDDASSDRTAEVARSLGARVVRRSMNGGAAAARNTGVDAATQPWLALLDSDDEWLPHHLATLWAARDGHVLVTGASLSCADDRVQSVGGVPGLSPKVITSPAQVVYPENLVSASGVLVRRDVVTGVGGYRTDLRFAEDFDLWLRVLEHGTGLALPTPVSLYHRHDEQKSNQRMAGRAAQRRAIEAHRASDWYSTALVRRREVVDAWDDLREGQTGGVRGMVVVLGTPARVAALLGLLVWRARRRRRGGAVARDGGPTIAVLPGTPDAAVAAMRSRPIVDLREVPWSRALLHLTRRPTGQAVVASRLVQFGIRALGIDPVPPAAVTDQVGETATDA
jgi:GT2 family glycosyltransferase